MVSGDKLVGMISKTDIAEPEGIEKAARFIRELNQDADIIKTSLIDSPDQELMEEIFRCMTK